MSGPSVHFAYRCSGKHKRGTFDAGPPRYQPAGTKCPDDLLESDILLMLEESVCVDGSLENANRFAMRRFAGRVELFESKPTGTLEGGRRVLHGHPVTPREVPTKVFRLWLQAGRLDAAEYRALVKGRGG